MLPKDVVRFDKNAKLETWPAIPAESLESGTPVQRGHQYIEDKDRGLTAGVWDCTAMTGKMSPYPVDEFMLLLEGELDIATADGKVTNIKAGESFILPKGLVCQWRQRGYIKKFYVILETPGEAKPIAGLSVIKPNVNQPLAPSQGPAADALLSGSPKQRAQEFFADATGKLTVGVWDTTAYHRKTVPFPRHELMCILEGEVSIAGISGQRQHFKAGDSFFVPHGAVTDFKTDGYLKKIYVIYQP